MKKSKFKLASLFILLFCLGSIAIPSSAAGTLTLHLPLDESAGATTFVDASGNGNHGTCSGNGCPTARLSGHVNGALQFDGVDDYIEVPYHADLNPGSFTVMAWAKVTGGSGTFRGVLASRDEPQSGYMLYASNLDQWEFWVGHGSDWEMLGDTPVTNNAWTHLAGVYDAATQTMRLYLNGELNAERSGVTYIVNPQRPLRVGASATEDAPLFFFDGLIDDVRVYDGVLTQTEIEAISGLHLYVDANAGGADDGSSWANAYTNLQNALTDASVSATSDVIHVAQGVYVPGSTVDDTFNVPPDTVLYGGYDTGGTNRDWEAYPTILSGDIDGDDANNDGNFIAETTADLMGDNAYRVVFMDGRTGPPITNRTVLDGFVVTAGRAIGSSGSNHIGGGFYCDGFDGGECSPMLRNLLFSGNEASSTGGAMYNDGAGAGDSSPTLKNVTFRGNLAFWDGGAMFNRCIFGGVSNPQLINVVFTDNQANEGGGVYNDGYDGTCNPVFTNVTFSSNGATSTGSGIYNRDSTTVIRNSIFWGNTNPPIFNDNSTTTISASVVESSGGSGGGWNAALGTDGGGNLDVDPRFTDAANGNFVPLYYSPAIDMGDNAVCPATDLRGDPRADWGCDAGAYEVQLADTTLVNKGVAGPGTYTFGPTQVRIEVTDTGGCLNGLEVQRVPHSHPYATTPLQTGAYWSITPGGCTSGFNATLTLPFAGADATSRACRWLGGTGPGYGWDCDDGTHTTFDDVNGWVIRSNVTGFSDWAVGNDVGPTAVTLADLGACSTPAWLPAMGLMVLGGLVLVRRRRR